MGKIAWTAVICSVITSIVWYAAMTFRDAFFASVLRSAVKAPGRMALEQIQRDLDSGNYDIAKAHLGILRQLWSRFEAEPGPMVEQGIGDIMVKFREMEESGTAPARGRSGL